MSDPIIVGGTPVGGVSASSFTFYRKGCPGKAPMHLRYDARKAQFFEELEEGKSDLAKALSKLNDRFTAKYKQDRSALRQKDVDLLEITDSQRLLMNFSVQYADADFIHQEVVPAFRTSAPSGQYLEYVRGVEFMAPADDRGGHGIRRETAETADYKRIKRGFSVESDSTTDFADKNEVIATNTPVNVLFELRERADRAHARKKEFRCVDLLTTTSNYGTGLVNELMPGTRWDEPDGDPATDILQMLPRIWKGNGSSRLVAWCNVDVWTALRDSRAIRRRLGANFAGFITPAMFVEMFGLDGLCVTEARVNTANQAKAASWGRVWPNAFGICRVSTTPQQKNASFGQRWRWVVPANQAADGLEVNMWFDPERGDYGSFGYKLADSEDYKVLAKDTGAFFKNPLASAPQMA